MLNGWIRWFIIIFGMLNLAHCIYSGCVGKWEVSCCEFTISMLFFLLALYDWTMERRLSATRRKWFRSGWVQGLNAMDRALLTRYKQLLNEEQSTVSPRVDEINRIRCRTSNDAWNRLIQILNRNNFKNDDYERENSTEDS